MNKNIQYISESIPCGLLLALAGGAMDSYSYIYRGKVFANAQTGNFLLLGVNLASGNYEISLRYFWPILAFILGIAISDFFKYKNEKFIKVHWKQLALILEALMLFLVSFIPANYNNIANSLISFSCALQVESFRMLKGNQIATTMCVGNIRSATSLLNDYYHVKDKHLLYSSFVYIAIILAFVLGAILESFAITYLEKKAILISVALLIGVFFMLFKDSENNTNY